MNTGESFIAHLVELRSRLLNAVVAVLLGRLSFWQGMDVRGEACHC
jgi:Rad3-related DNA helicase